MTSVFSHRVGLLLAFVFLVGCASTPQSSRITTDDLQTMASEMAESLRASDFLAQRNASSPPVYVSIDKVLNLSSDVLPEAERWRVMHDLRGRFPITSLWTEKQVRFVLPPERVQQYRLSTSGEDYDALGSDRRVTHTITATFYSSTRTAAGESRTDSYYCGFQMIDLATGLIVWDDRFEYKRRAIGRVLD